MRFVLLLSLLLVCSSSTSGLADDDKITPEQQKFFETKIRPVLAEKCFQCHSPSGKDVAGELNLDSKSGIRLGGDSGPAIEPGKPDDSLLIHAIEYQDRDLAMPPKKAGGKLPDAVIADFRRWVEMGAPDPRDDKIVGDAGAGKESLEWWAFQPRRNVTPPPVDEADWVKNDIDRFILAQLRQNGLKPVQDADPLTLLRRVYFDLTGLPPTEQTAKEFQQQWQSAASESERDRLFEEVVERLLASAQFGERWGRHWLDVARYAESSGKDVNVLYPLAWRYRDYVIDAFNDDMPFDQFIREQIAGDLLPAATPADRDRQQVATGFLAIGPKSLNEMNARQFVVDLADEQIDAVSQSFVGLTIACARCHDHKFDPISQEDYTALSGIFLSTDTCYGTSGGVGGRNAGNVIELSSGPTLVADLTPAAYEAKKKQIEDLRKEQREAALERLRNRGSDNAVPINILRITNQLSQLEAELKNYSSDGTARPLAMGVTDKPRTAPRGLQARQYRARNSGFVSLTDSPLFIRGDVGRPSDRVPRAIPPILPGVQSPPISSGSSGRLELSQWLTDPANPLTSRVAANRVWHWLFGSGIVSSVDNFGTSGTLPSHPELLDFLANQLIEEHWSMKSLIRQIVLSHTYRLSSDYVEANYITDPANALLWRHSTRRLEAEEIRDAMLSVAGRLDLSRPTGSIIARSGDGLLGGPRGRGLSESAITMASNPNRSIYMSIGRNVEPEVLAVFDLPDAAGVQGDRSSTNVPSQSLFLLNSDFTEQQAKALAARVNEPTSRSSRGERFDRRQISDKMDQLFWIVFNRPPTTEETNAAIRLLSEHRRDLSAGWTSVARALLSTAEFRSLD